MVSFFESDAKISVFDSGFREMECGKELDFIITI